MREMIVMRRLGQAQRDPTFHDAPSIVGSRPAKVRGLTQPTAVAIAATLLAISPAAAQTGAAFYKDKTVTYIVATAPGGGYDAYGRLVSEYMQKHLPGSTIVVKNVPGAGHLIGANTVYGSKPDGLTIGTFNTGLVYNQLIKTDGVRFDLTRMTWIGKAGSDPRVIAMSNQSGIASLADLRAAKAPVNFATSGIGSANYVEITLLANLASLPIKLLTGYNGNDDQLAMRRGEVGGGLGARSSFEPFVKNGYGRFIAQIGGRERDVPQLSQMLPDGPVKPLIAFVEAQTELARFTVGPPAIPADRRDALVAAFRSAMLDPELQARAARIERPLEPAYGDDVLKIVQRALIQPADLVAALKEAMKPMAKGK